MPLAISHHMHTLQKQVSRPLISCSCFTWLLWVSSMIASYLPKATTVLCKLLFNLLQGRHRSNPIQLKLEKLTPASHLWATELLVAMKPVSRKRTSNVGPSRFDPTIPRNQEKTKEGSKTHITAHKNFCVLLEKTSTHEPGSWCHCWGTSHGTKLFLRTGKTYHGHDHLREGRSDPHTLIDR